MISTLTSRGPGKVVIFLLTRLKGYCTTELALNLRSKHADMDAKAYSDILMTTTMAFRGKIGEKGSIKFKVHLCKIVRCIDMPSAATGQVITGALARTAAKSILCSHWIMPNHSSPKVLTADVAAAVLTFSFSVIAAVAAAAAVSDAVSFASHMMTI